MQSAPRLLFTSSSLYASCRSSHTHLQTCTHMKVQVLSRKNITRPIFTWRSALRVYHRVWAQKCVLHLSKNVLASLSGRKSSRSQLRKRNQNWSLWCVYVCVCACLCLCVCEREREIKIVCARVCMLKYTRTDSDRHAYNDRCNAHQHTHTNTHTLSHRQDKVRCQVCHVYTKTDVYYAIILCSATFRRVYKKC